MAFFPSEHNIVTDHLIFWKFENNDSLPSFHLRIMSLMGVRKIQPNQ